MAGGEIRIANPGGTEPPDIDAVRCNRDAFRRQAATQHLALEPVADCHHVIGAEASMGFEHSGNAIAEVSLTANAAVHGAVFPQGSNLVN